MRCALISSIRAGFISEQPAAKFTPHATQVIIGSRSLETYLQFCQSKFKRSREETPNPNDQIPNNYQAQRFKNPKHVGPSWIWDLEIWTLLGIWVLGFGAYTMIRIVLPHHLRTLAKVGDE